MKTRRQWIVWTGIAVILGCATVATAAPPWKRLIPFRKVDADPHQSYWLTEDQGPWMIFATSFAGDGAEQQAHELVLELRRRYKMEAFMHKRHFDYTKPVTGRGMNRYGGPKRMKYAKATQFDEIAVVVGNYTGFDVPGAKQDLESIKSIRPDCLKVGGENGKKTTQRLVVLRELQRLVHTDPEKRNQGPMRRAFVARNPLLPKEYFVSTGMDPLVLHMNRGVKHSLLDNPGRYTVRVASFRGDSHFLGEESDDTQAPKKHSFLGLPSRGKTDKLELAAENAHKLTEALRKRGIEAYEFHDRFESIVTIGSFQSVGNPLPNGKIDLQPAIYKIMQTYGAKRSQLPQHGQAMQPRSLEGINFDIQPLPVEVPHKSLASDYTRR